MPTNYAARSQERDDRLLWIVLPAIVCATFAGFQLGALSTRRRKQRAEAEEERRQYEAGRSAGMQHHPTLRKLIYNSTGRGFGIIKRVYVVPGGGPGSGKDAGYPPWTAQRVEKALERYDAKFAETTAFLALGAGSMNAPSPRGGNGHVIFESARIAEELARGGVPQGSIIADFASWDTVGNAWFARLAVEAMLDMSFRLGDKAEEPHPAPPPPSEPLPTPRKLPYPGSALSGKRKGHEGGESKRTDLTRTSASEAKRDVDDKSLGVGETDGVAPGFGVSEEVKRSLAADEEKGLPAARAGEAYSGGEMRRWMSDWKTRKARARKGPLNITVFVSDFHAERMDTVFQWVFGLEPSLLKDGKTTVTTVSIDTPAEMWSRGAEQRQARLAHEREATEQARLRAKEIRTVEEFRAFLMLGGHKGYFDLTHGRYRASEGSGWGGAS